MEALSAVERTPGITHELLRAGTTLEEKKMTIQAECKHGCALYLSVWLKGCMRKRCKKTPILAP
jgi:hypothetical protein